MTRRFAVSSLALVAALASLVAPQAHAQLKPNSSTLDATEITISSQPIGSFLKDGSGGDTFGKLKWRGGLVLSSQSDAFGGWSGLAFDGDGERVVAVSDAGTWMTAKLTEKNGRPTGLTDATIGALRARENKELAKGRDRDAEAVTILDGGISKGTLLIAFEQNDRIGRFPIAKGTVSAPSIYLTMPPEARAMRSNGIEAMTVMRGGAHKGSVIAFGEDKEPRSGVHAGWIWIAGVPKRFTLPGIGDWGITDVASLSDGTVLLLERRFRWSEGVKMRIRKLSAADIKAGHAIKGDVLIEADMAAEIDNMECLAVREESNGDVVLTLLSDDNFNHLIQRTVLLQFAWSPKAKARPSSASTE